MTAQSAFLDNFENVENRRVDIREDIKRYQDTQLRSIIESSVGFTDVGLLRISECVRAYAYVILSSQASARSSIVGNTASALTAQSAFLDNFENVENRRVDIREDIKRYQDTQLRSIE